MRAATNEVWSLARRATGNTRVVVFDADTGAFKRMWAPSATSRRETTIAKIISPKTFPDAEGPAQFNIVHAIRVAKDGMVYAADRKTGVCRCSAATASS